MVTAGTYNKLIDEASKAGILDARFWLDGPLFSAEDIKMVVGISYRTKRPLNRSDCKTDERLALVSLREYIQELVNDRL